MGLRLDDRWTWDLWLAEDGDDAHVFYLQAPRSLGDPELRHRNATVGHAVSRDLRTWEVLPDALGRGPAGAFDDVATWTGCVVPAGDGWRMYYTGICAVDGRQRIGAARSAGLLAWKREGVLCESDPRWYEANDWRDPWVFAHDGALHMLVCARAVGGPLDERGVVGHALSDDGGATWTPGPPLSQPGELRQIEVPQLLEPGGGSLRTVLGCAGVVDHSAARLARGAAREWGMCTLTGPSPLGPFVLDDGPFLLGSERGTHYAGRAVERDGRLWLLSWLLHDADGAFLGELADPIELRRDAAGRVALA